jgi:hypothetical protein
MKRSPDIDGSNTTRPGGWRRRAAAGLLALGLTFPGVTHPYSLEQLLRLPLERLLQLKISAQPVAQTPNRDASTARGLPAAGRVP